MAEEWKNEQVLPTAKDSTNLYGKIFSAKCGCRQVVRRQPSKLIFVGPNPITRSEIGS